MRWGRVPSHRRVSPVTSEKFNRLRTQLYTLLHDEIRKAVAESGGRIPSVGPAL